MKHMKANILFFSALAAAAPVFEHKFQERDYVYKTNLHITTTTVYITIWVDPAQPTTTGEIQAVSTSLANSQVHEVNQSQSFSTSTPIIPSILQPTVVEPPAQPTPTPSTSIYTLPAQPTSPIYQGTTSSSSASTPQQTGGGISSGAPTGETHTNIRLSPFALYNTAGGSLNGNWGACAAYPNNDRDPLWYEDDTKNDMKVMLHPPGGNIMKYCGAILKVTSGNGKTATVTVVDSCAECGGEGGMDMMKAPWKEAGGPTDDPVWGSSWTIVGWAPKMAPAYRV